MGRRCPTTDNWTITQRIEEDGCRNGQRGRSASIPGRTVGANREELSKSVQGEVVAAPRREPLADCGRSSVLFPYRRNLLLAHQTARHLAFQATDLPVDWNWIRSLGPYPTLALFAVPLISNQSSPLVFILLHPGM